LLAAERADATLQFQKVFVREYIADHPDCEFAEFVQRKVKCNICHQGTKDRTQHNRFGAELARLLDHRADKDDGEKIIAALRTVADLPADPSQADGPTFGHLIEAGKLPGGDLEDAKREPTK
jgi:hypothetical protein